MDNAKNLEVQKSWQKKFKIDFFNTDISKIIEIEKQIKVIEEKYKKLIFWF